MLAFDNEAYKPESSLVNIILPEEGYMKKNGKFLLVFLVLLIGVMPFLFACNDTGDDVHIHSYVDIITEPTCIAPGYTTHTCSSCGDSYTSSYVEITEQHDYGADNHCKDCNMRRPGLYQSGTNTLLMTWDELIYEDILSVDAKTIFSAQADMLAGDLVLSSDITNIEREAFLGCSGLTSVAIAKASKLTTIGANAFQECENLTGVELPDGVTTIGDNAFYGCSELASIEIPSSVVSIGKKAFGDCSKLMEKEGGVIYLGKWAVGYDTPQTNYVLRKDTVGIAAAAFYESKTIESIDIPEGVVVIGAAAFNECTNLSSLEIPSSVVSIGRYAFFGCDNLIQLIDGVEYVGNWAIRTHGYPIKNFQLREGTVGIADEAFTNEHYGETFLIPDGLMYIGTRAFYDCYQLRSINIPNSVARIGDEAFSYCKNMKTITLPASVISIGCKVFCESRGLKEITVDEDNACYKSVEGVLYSKDGKELICFPAGKYAKEFEIPDEVVYIDHHAFYWASVGTLTIGNSVQEIGDYAFSECTFKSVMISASVKSIGNYAFYRCTILASISFAEKSDAGWLGSVLLPKKSNLTEIGRHAFASCDELKRIEIPEGVSYLPMGVFDSCRELTDVTIPASVRKIGGGAFRSCRKLSVVKLAEESQLERIAPRAFEYCDVLACITFGNTKEKWSAVSFEFSSDEKKKSYTVYCIDGTVTNE